MASSMQNVFFLTNVMLIIGGITLIAFGLAQIFSKEMIWQVTEWANQKQGRKSIRPPFWDRATTVMGTISVFMGVLFLFLKK
jgi:hypothetical protein